MVFVSFALVVSGIVDGAEVVPTADEIMAKSYQAMGVAAHYQIVSQGMEISIYQKPLPDGSLAMLTDISVPIKKTTIMYGDKSYDLYLDKKIAVDTHILFAGAKNLPEFAPFVTASKDIQSDQILNRTLTYNGRECYEIDQILQFPPSLLEALPASTAKSLPAKTRFVIDVETFVFIEQETFASDGSSLSKLQYVDFEPMPDLTDDISFLTL